MRLLPVSGWADLSGLKRTTRLPAKDALLFAFVAITVAVSVAFLAQHLQSLTQGIDAAYGAAIGRDALDDLPDVMSNRCLGQDSKRF